MTVKVELQQAADGFPWDSVFGLLPHVFWIAAGVVLLQWIGRDRLIAVLQRVQKLSIAGVDFDFGEAVETAAKAKSQAIPRHVGDRLGRRIERSLELTQGARLLWVDDNPNNNFLEREILEAAGIEIDRALSSDSARQLLLQRKYDVMVSDWERGGDATAGLDLAKELFAKSGSPPLIFYCGRRREKPVEAFGLTPDPTEFINLVLDALTRVRG